MLNETHILIFHQNFIHSEDLFKHFVFSNSYIIDIDEQFPGSLSNHIFIENHMFSKHILKAQIKPIFVRMLLICGEN